MTQLSRIGQALVGSARCLASTVLQGREEALARTKNLSTRRALISFTAPEDRSKYDSFYVSLAAPGNSENSSYHRREGISKSSWVVSLPGVSGQLKGTLYASGPKAFDCLPLDFPSTEGSDFWHYSSVQVVENADGELKVEGVSHKAFEYKKRS